MNKRSKSLGKRPSFTSRHSVSGFVESSILLAGTRWSDREEAGLTTPAEFPRVQNISGAGIVFYAATITFGSIDWAMSLEPKWFSTVWGMIFMVGEVLTALCFTVWLLVKLAPMEP